MIRLYGGGAAALLMGCLIAGVSGGAYAQSDSQTQSVVPSGMRQTKIKEVELSSDRSPRRENKQSKKRRSAGGRKSGAGAALADGEAAAAPEGARRNKRGAGTLPLLARITKKTSPQRAASLKLVDEGHKALEAGEYRQALGTFERSIAVDATNPYSHYFVARAHFFLGNYPVSFNFLDVAESLLGWHKLWLSEIYVLKGRNATGMGFFGRADTNYLRALRFDPYNRFAFERLANIEAITPGADSPAP